MKKYTVTQSFTHGRGNYRQGQEVVFHPTEGDELKRAGLLIDYVPPNPPEPGRESSASRPGRASRKQTPKSSASTTQQDSAE